MKRGILGAPNWGQMVAKNLLLRLSSLKSTPRVPFFKVSKLGVFNNTFQPHCLSIMVELSHTNQAKEARFGIALDFAFFLDISQ